MNAVVPAQPKSVTVDMANRYGMEPAAFEATLRNTIMPMSRGAMMQPTREEFAAFLLVAREYRLNPITRQIYAFPKKGGGIIPVVSVDGWAFLVNEHPAFDGMEFEDAHDDQGKLISVTCRIFRKDRRMPVSVTEYLSECKRDTDPWAMQHRMLRHKALIQCARYAFAFSGIYDEDEAEKFAALPPMPRRDDPPPPPRRQSPPAQQAIEHQPEPQPVEDARFDAPPAETEQADDVVSKDSLLTELDERMGFAKTADEVEEAYTDFDAEALLSDYEGGVEAARKLKAQHLDRVPAVQQEKSAAPPADDDFPGNDAIAAAQASTINPALVSTRDPFAIPERFKGGGHYTIFINDAVAAASSDDADSLYACWAKTGEQRKSLRGSGQLTDDSIQRLKDAVQAKLNELRPAADDEPTDLPPLPPRRQQQPADPIAAYTAQMEAAFAAATTKEAVDKFWFATVDTRDESGATEDQQTKWRLARSKAKNALPSQEG